LVRLLAVSDEVGILDHFPGRTEADLYLWITARWLELSRSEQPAGPAEAIADILFAYEGIPGAPPPPHLVTMLKKWLGPPRRAIELPASFARRAKTSVGGLKKPPARGFRPRSFASPGRRC
jgi:hypothetical protein